MAIIRVKTVIQPVILYFTPPHNYYYRMVNSFIQSDVAQNSYKTSRTRYFNRVKCNLT